MSGRCVFSRRTRRDQRIGISDFCCPFCIRRPEAKLRSGLSGRKGNFSCLPDQEFRNCELPLSGSSLSNSPNRVRAVRPWAYFLFVFSAQLTALKGGRGFLDDDAEANFVESLVKEIAALSHGWDQTELLAAGDASEVLPGTARPGDRYIRLLLPVLYMPPGSEVAIQALREEGKFLLFTGSGIS